MKNYYEILEVSKNASVEVIDKAYKVLAKKYHPDLQEEAKKKWAEEQFKMVSEAYEVLSDPIKRQEHDQELEVYEESLRQSQSVVQEPTQGIDETIRQNENRERQFREGQPTRSEQFQNVYDPIEYQKRILQEEELELQRERQRAYHHAYLNSLRSMGYRIRYRKTWKDYLAVVLTIFILIIIGMIIWHIPVTHDYLVNLYQENNAVHFIADIIGNIFKSIGNMFSGK